MTIIIISIIDGIGESEWKLLIFTVEAASTSSCSINGIISRQMKKLIKAAAILASTRGVRLIFPDVTALI